MLAQRIRLSSSLSFTFHLTLIVHHLLLVVAIPLPHADDDTKSGHLSAKDIGQLTALSPQQHEQQVKLLENRDVGLETSSEIDRPPDFQKSVEPPPDESSRYESTLESSHSLVSETQRTPVLVEEAVTVAESSEEAEEVGGAEVTGGGGVDLEDDALMENLGTSLDSMKKRLLIDKIPANTSPAEPSDEEAREMYRVVDHIPQHRHHNHVHHQQQWKTATGDHPPKIKESTPGRSSGIDEKELNKKPSNPRSEEAAKEEMLEVNCSTSAESAATPDVAFKEAAAAEEAASLFALHNDNGRTPKSERSHSAQVPYESIVRGGPASINVEELVGKAAERSSDNLLNNRDDVKEEKSVESPAALNLMIAVVKHHHRANPTVHNDDNYERRLSSPEAADDAPRQLLPRGKGQAEEFPLDQSQTEEFEEEEDVTRDADDEEKLTLWQKIVLGIRCAKQDCRDTLIARRLAEAEAQQDANNHRHHRRITEWSIMRRMKRRFRKGEHLATEPTMSEGNSTSDEKLCGCEALRRLNFIERRHQKKATRDSTKTKDSALKKSLEV